MPVQISGGRAEADLMPRQLYIPVTFWVRLAVPIFIILSSGVASAQTATPAPVLYTLGGPVYMGTTSIQTTPDLAYRLSVYRGNTAKTSGADAVQEAYSAEVRIDTTGRYRFERVPLLSNDLYVVTTTYEGIVQGSAALTFDGKATPPELPITLFAGTKDPAKLVIARSQQVMSFVSPGVMRVLETMTVLNQGDRFYLSEQRASDGALISAQFPLPVGARAIGFNTLPTDRFHVAGDTNSPIVQDTKPIIPGVAQDVIYSYQLPYAKGAAIDRDYLYPLLSFQVTLPTDAGIAAYGLPFAVTRTAAQDTGRALSVYTLEKVTLKDGKRLIYSLDGAARNPEVAQTRSVGVDFGAVLIMLVFLVAGVIVLLVMLRRASRKA